MPIYGPFAADNPELDQGQLIVQAANEVMANMHVLCGTHFDSGDWFSVDAGGTATWVWSTNRTTVLGSSGATAASRGQLHPFPATTGFPKHVANARTDPWYFAARFRVNTAVDAQARAMVGLWTDNAAGVVGPGVGIGVFGPVSATEFQASILDAARANVVSVDCNAAIDTAWHYAVIWNDGTTVHVLLDGVEVGTTAASNLPTSFLAAGAWVDNGTTAANRGIEVDYAYVVVQEAA